MTDPIKVNGRTLDEETEVSIKGERGRFRFVGVFNGDGSGTFYGGVTGHEMFRSFHLDRISRVHNKTKLRGNE